MIYIRGICLQQQTLQVQHNTEAIHLPHVYVSYRHNKDLFRKQPFHPTHLYTSNSLYQTSNLYFRKITFQVHKDKAFQFIFQSTIIKGNKNEFGQQENGHI